MLEQLDHADSSFVTLTYAEDKVPLDLRPDHFSGWLKRLRKRIAPRRIRFYGVGEYGERTDRPHYHAALFGWPSCSAGQKISGVCQCLACSVVRETWGFGHVNVARLELKSAQYIAGYVTKKMTSRSDARLYGRAPEFARMSLRPGIGANAMWNVASEMMRYKLEKRGDVPLILKFGGRNLPLGRYLRGKLRLMVDTDEKFKENSCASLEEGLRIVRAYAWQNDRSVQSVFEEINEPYARQMAARDVIKGRTL